MLDPVASDLWDFVVAGGPDAAGIARLAREYGVAPDRVARDYSAFLQTCLDEGLIEMGVPPPPSLTITHRGPSAGKAPGVLLALYSMVATAWSLRRRGFPATYQEYSRMPRGGGGTDSAFHLRRFLRAENFFLSSRGVNDCLVRSLSLFRFLNAVGLRAHHVIGVRRFPFAAHAWVEIDGRAVQHDGVGDFAPIARM